MALFDIVHPLAHVVRGALPALANKGDDVLGLRLEWVGVPRLDRVDGLVGIAVCAHDERRKFGLERLSELVRGGRQLLRVGIGRACVCVRGQHLVELGERGRDHGDRGDAGEDGDLGRLRGLLLCGRRRHCGCVCGIGEGEIWDKKAALNNDDALPSVSHVILLRSRDRPIPGLPRSYSCSRSPPSASWQ